jgi:phage-related protein
MEIDVQYLPEASEFMFTIDKAASKKLAYNVSKVCSGIKDKDIFKKLENTNIWEFRTLHNGNCYRLLSFWDTRTKTLIVATHGMVKKTQKTPRKEIAKAEAIRKNYFENN